jgi:hypothetical protein
MSRKSSNVCLELEASLSLSLSRGSAWHGSRKMEKEEEGSFSVRNSENSISLNLVWRFTTCKKKEKKIHDVFTSNDVL